MDKQALRRIRVELGALSYDICIGSDIGEEIRDFVARSDFSGRAMIITDSHVGPLYGERLSRLLGEAGMEVFTVTVPAGESSKSLSRAEKIYTRCIESGLDRKSPVFALGGGVVGDLAGFVAATYMRGVPFVQVPTSLLAQVDSGVGGKVAVNHALGKNLIGAFYQPRAVFMDLQLLKTLPPREISAGLGEVVKYGLIYDADFFAFLERQAGKILQLDTESLTHIIARSCEIKAAVVSRDEREAGLRRILNFGHTIGHAIEKETGYQQYNHGEAVAIGMMGATELSIKMGLLEAAALPRVKQLLVNLNLPVKAPECGTEAMYLDILHDKKTVNGIVSWVLLEDIGRAVCHSDMPRELVREVMQDCCR